MMGEKYESLFEMSTVPSAFHSIETLIMKRNPLCFYCIEANYCHLHDGGGRAYKIQTPSNEFPQQAGITSLLIVMRLVERKRTVQVDLSQEYDANTFIKKIKDETSDDDYDSDATIPALQEGVTDSDDSELDDYESENIKKMIFTKAIGEETGKTRFRPKKFVCDVCDALFTLKQNVQWHLLKYHMLDGPIPVNNEKIRYKCLLCLHLFKTASAAAIHDRKVHKKSIKQEVKAKDPISCEECGKLFASTFQLKEHISILHLRERKFECEVCGQKFGRRGGVRRHVQMVHLNQLHKCPYDTCDHPGYKCSKALAAHIRSVHTNIRPYECDVCGKNFVRRNDLKMHELTHTEEAAFHCSCGSSFRRALYLKKHQRQCPCSSEVNSPEYDSPAE
ncbi:hypothetical protein PFISCL1PPCAC_5801 [Pristionchus fissidentatus]|uniref:C2H2-type domain-containing protein n=1 Tax=Pristionchus fissidentatus TaxID=1538716 RepID=A0AAV5V7P3_9BILA|nr:hypothetical protein PFISCL1PPCAC_5801 [Pristionchus fissidentatus]